MRRERRKDREIDACVRPKRVRHLVDWSNRLAEKSVVGLGGPIRVLCEGIWVFVGCPYVCICVDVLCATYVSNLTVSLTLFLSSDLALSFSLSFFLFLTLFLSLSQSFSLSITSSALSNFFHIARLSWSESRTYSP